MNAAGAQNITDRHFYVQALNDEECQCGRPKVPGNAFCYICYKSLPDHLQKGLYRNLGDGFEAAYEEASLWLDN